MTDQSTPEPTMEEILASIRRIISEDDAPAETPPAQGSAEEPAPEPVASSAMMDETPSNQDDPADEVLDLTDRYEAPERQTIGDLDVAAPEPEPAPEPAPMPEHRSESAFAQAAPPAETPAHPSRPQPSEGSGDGLVGAKAAGASASAFAGLSAAVRRPEPQEPQTGGGPTIDDLARQLLRPMLKDWLDANLPAIVEAQVRREVERIARQAG